MLSSTYRIPKDNIANVVRRGKRFSSEFFDIKVWYEDSLNSPLFTFIVSTKVDKRAVVRNTIKRKFRAAIYQLLRENKNIFRKGSYVVLMKSVNVNDFKSQQIASLIKETLS